LQYVTISESDSRDKIAFLENGAKFTLKNISFEKLMQELPADSFCRVNKKDLIAVRIVQHFTFDEITSNILLSTGKYLTHVLSDVYRSDFIKMVKR
jgi:hypothetical protein